MDANINAATYPKIEEIIGGLQKLSKRVISFDATELALSAGNERTMNVVMLGALAATGKLPYEVEQLRKAIAERVPQRTIDANMRAFDSGVARANGRM
jgi:indolepyruvate ferredoxin oxidoreductase beta subunit